MKKLESTDAFYDEPVQPKDLELEKQKDVEEKYASAMEECIATCFAPENMTNEGRYGIIVMFVILTIVMSWGCYNVEVNFSTEFFIPAGTPTEEYVTLDLKYYETGFTIDTIVDN